MNVYNLSNGIVSLSKQIEYVAQHLPTSYLQVVYHLPLSPFFGSIKKTSVLPGIAVVVIGSYPVPSQSQQAVRMPSNNGTTAMSSSI